MKSSKRLCFIFFFEQLHIVSFVNSRKKSNDPARLQTLIPDDLVKHSVGIIKKFFRFNAYHRIFENSRITSREHPGLEERCPVYIFSDLIQRVIHKLLTTNK